jgi:hypothetical protein
MNRLFGLTAIVIVVALLGAASGRAGTASDSALGAKTEATGFNAIARYLAQRDQHVLSPAQVATLGAKTEAKGYAAIVRYQEQHAATPMQVEEASPGFSWHDSLIGATLATGLFLLGGAAALMLRQRRRIARQP